ncbi:MAG: hypothetical protein K0S56_551 [Microvirga sp.]|jgi:hypothetical protein|nr:hypothetical protein [Microvirga sp.]
MRTTRRPVVTKAAIAPKTPEWRHQGAAVTALRRARDKGWPIRIAGDMNAARRSPRERGLAAATGMNAGEPDLRVYITGPRLLLIEYKTKQGEISVDQKQAHAELKALGFEVIVIQAATPEEAAELTVALVAARIPANDNTQPVDVAA